MKKMQKCKYHVIARSDFTIHAYEETSRERAIRLASKYWKKSNRMRRHFYSDLVLHSVIVEKRVVGNKIREVIWENGREISPESQIVFPDMR